MRLVRNATKETFSSIKKLLNTFYLKVFSGSKMFVVQFSERKKKIVLLPGNRNLIISNNSISYLLPPWAYQFKVKNLF